MAYSVARPFFEDEDNRKPLIEACKYLLSKLKDSEGDEVMASSGNSSS